MLKESNGKNRERSWRRQQDKEIYWWFERDFQKNKVVTSRQVEFISDEVLIFGKACVETNEVAQQGEEFQYTLIFQGYILGAFEFLTCPNHFRMLIYEI